MTQKKQPNPIAVRPTPETESWLLRNAEAGFRSLAAEVRMQLEKARLSETSQGATQ